MFCRGPLGDRLGEAPYVLEFEGLLHQELAAMRALAYQRAITDQIIRVLYNTGGGSHRIGIRREVT